MHYKLIKSAMKGVKDVRGLLKAVELWGACWFLKECFGLYILFCFPLRQVLSAQRPEVLFLLQSLF